MCNKKSLTEEVTLYNLHKEVSQIARDLSKDGKEEIANKIWSMFDNIGLSRVPDRARGERLEELLRENKNIVDQDKDNTEEVVAKLEAIREYAQTEIKEREKLHEHRLRDQVALLTIDRIITSITSRGLVINADEATSAAFRLADSFITERKKS